MRSLFLLPIATLLSGSTAAPNVVEITGTDYAFTAPATIPAGKTTFVFKNSGKHAHEFNVFLLKKGATLDSMLKLRRADKPQLGVVVEGPVGVLFADPNSTAAAKITADLLPGRDYGVICIFSDSTGQPRHYDLGMYKVIHTAPAAVTKAEVKTKVDTIVASDYAYPRYPREVSPGIRELAFRNTGKQRHEFLFGLLKKGVTLDSVLAVEKRDGDVLPLFDTLGPNGVLYSVGGESSLGNMIVDFLPGREYMFECGFQDNPKAPPHNKMGMYGVIKVRNR